MTVCPECGALNCEARFHEFLAREFVDPAYGAVHHLTVATYMLQHSCRLSPAGWLFERQLLEDFVERGLQPAEVWNQRRADLDDGRRRFKISSIDGRPLFEGMHWNRTVLDVRQEPAESYREDVTAWARQTLLDSLPVRLESYES